MRSCESIDPLVTPYVDRELPDDDRQAVDLHLRACPPCYSRVVAEQAVRDLLHARQPELNRKEAPVKIPDQTNQRNTGKRGSTNFSPWA